jgi:hypothetical protein
MTVAAAEVVVGAARETAEVIPDSEECVPQIALK